MTTPINLSECAACHELFPGGGMRCYPGGVVCEACHQLREEAGTTKRVFGESPRFNPPPLVTPKASPLL